MTQAANLAALGTNASSTGTLGANSFAAATVPNSALSANPTFRNRIINGNFLIWQRATSLTTASNQVYGFADRWLTNAGASTTWSQSTDAPAGFKYSVSCAGSTFNGINQRIESFNCTDLAGQAVTFSFWAKQSSGSSSININLSYANSADNFSATTGIVETAISASPSSSWTRYSYTYTMPAGVANGLQIILFNAAAASTTLYTGIQVELGSVASPFENRLYGTELQLCYRYFWQGYVQAAGNWGGSGGSIPIVAWAYPVVMRTTPSWTWISGGAAGNGNVGLTITAAYYSVLAANSAILLYSVSGSTGSNTQGCVVDSCLNSFSAEL